MAYLTAEVPPVYIFCVFVTSSLVCAAVVLSRTPSRKKDTVVVVTPTVGMARMLCAVPATRFDAAPPPGTLEL